MSGTPRPVPRRRSVAARFIRFVLPPLAPLVIGVAAMEMLARGGVIREYLLPPPSRVWRTLCDDGRPLLRGLGNTTIAALAGFALSVSLGVTIAVLLASHRWIRRSLYPYAVFFQTVPILAIAPLLVIWLGYGLPTAIASAFVASVFPVIANTLNGLRSTDPALIDLFRLYGASGGDTLFKLRLPSALPSILTGLRIAGGLAVIGAIVGEFIGGSGSLGDLMTSAIAQQRNDLVFAAVLLASLLGLALFGAINLASYLALRNWHPSER
jgi:NitT/TauT family transport system permease protein